mmetsp:Transcript_17673/g.31962  ORF Transcript_17673/g.31962 Transcript_17673/m.31962 type:complete len:92 (-) Transcript_17673:277-552(-)|eukprot:CAMPEP_0201601354 /NCGR_PEP_ID=MMETSP0492-20130828/2333_1 /ASSEMBLY_ACC=CAM_ASM_000837 /TAXON_ID=420259 /ORGANISM="Thalassiosira gravida, Strain GMp14c1" /LENGTH=91 /DNA_ID=CAMNT_0048064535 /DNA_START=122 /DNA_END=397 /DNA_ORIENTATION=+
MKIIGASFLSDLEAQMKDVYAAQNLQNTSLDAMVAQAKGQATNENNNSISNKTTLKKRLSMQKDQAWALRERTRMSERTIITTGDYDGEFC